eukprot:403367830
MHGDRQALGDSDRGELGRIEDDEDFNDKYEVHTLIDVIKEIRDEQTRIYLQNLPYELIVHGEEYVDASNMILVSNFAKDTGDFKTLSKVDMRVIALGVQLAREKGEFEKLKQEPKPLQEFRPKKFQQDYERLEEEDEYDSEEEESESKKKQQQTPADDGFQQVKQGKHGSRKNHVKPKPAQKQEDDVENGNKVDGEVKVNAQVDVNKTEEEQVLQKEEQDDNDVPSDLDDEEEGGQWITPENIHKHILGGETAPIKKKNQEDGPQLVQMITSDYAMQNVIIQLGFKLLSLDGRRITRVKRFKLLCRACQKLNLNVEKMFCDHCGSHTLIKVSVYIKEDGTITYFKNPKRRVNLKGKIYSIPKPVGGRNNNDLVLREDELMTGEKKMLVKKIEKEHKKLAQTLSDTIQGNYWAGGEGYGAGAAVSNLLYENGAKGGRTHSKMVGMTDSIVIGYGKQNPNKVKKRTGN